MDGSEAAGVRRSYLAAIWATLGIVAGVGLVLVAFILSGGYRWLPAIALFSLAPLLGKVSLERLLDYRVGVGVLFALFALAAGGPAGVGVYELVFLGYFVAFASYWIFTRLIVYGDSLINDMFDGAVAALLAVVTLSAGWGFANGGALTSIAGEWASMILLFFYFPFRDYVRDRDNASTWLVGFIIAAAIFAVCRNIYNFSDIVANALDLRGVATGRVASTEVVIYVATIASAALMMRMTKSMGRVVALFAFITCVFGLILTQFRAYYIAVLIALLVIFLLSDTRQRLHLTYVLIFTVIGFVSIAYMLLGDLFIVFAGGVLERVLSIATATSVDESLINRFHEYEVVWGYVKNSPIIGYGIGVDFGFYDSIFQFTWEKSYVHNVYLHLMYKFGIIGLLLFLVVAGWAAVRALRVARGTGSALEQASGTFVVAMLAGLSVAALVTVLFNTDTTLPLAACFAIASGLTQRAERGYTKNETME